MQPPGREIQSVNIQQFSIVSGWVYMGRSEEPAYLCEAARNAETRYEYTQSY